MKIDSIIQNMFDISDLPSNYTQFLNENRYNKDLTINTQFKSNLKVSMCDQTASSFPLKYVDNKIQKLVYPYYSNTHSNNCFGRLMSKMIETSKQEIMKSVNGSCEIHKILFTGNGCSGAINHFVHLIEPILINSIVFISDLEHYSNYLPWYHKAKKLVVINTTEDGLIDENQLVKELKKYKNKMKLISFSAASNVTCVIQNVDELCKIGHKYGAKVFFDYAASAPYVDINITKNKKEGEYIDAIFFSPHKFPGAQGTPGIVIFDKSLACNTITYTPSGGTVRFLSEKDGPIYTNEIEKKEMGGTPNIIGIIKTALCIKIKTHYLPQIIKHENELNIYFSKYLKQISKKCPNIKILNPNFFSGKGKKLPIFIFQLKDYHYNYVVALLSDLFGISTRGGISCSGVLAKKLLHICDSELNKIKKNILNNKGVANNYGWVRLTLHSIHTKEDLKYISKSIYSLCKNIHMYTDYYKYIPDKNIYNSKACNDGICVEMNVNSY